VALHVGTLLAVIVYFRHDLAQFVRAGIASARKRRIETANERLAWLIVLATIPAAAIGAAGEGFIEDELGQPWQIAILLVVFALLLGAADRLPQRRDMEGLGWRSALGIGFAQSLALAPGVSRSGVTITAGRALGLTRDASARFSFLLLAPVVTGASIVEGADLAREGIPPGSAGPMVVGVVAAAVSGFAAIWWLLRYVRRHSYDIFVWYRLVTAAVVIGLIATGVQPSTF
jgi:undecaprenyl-diphosphatase